MEKKDFNIIKSKGVIGNSNHKSEMSTDFIDLNKAEKFEKDKMKKEEYERLELAIRIRKQEEFFANPYPLPFKVYNQCVVVPSVIIDEYRHEGLGKILHSKKSKEELAIERTTKYRQPFPVAALDSEIAGINELDLLLLNVGGDLVKNYIYYNGVEFWVINFYDVLSKIPKESLSLLGATFSNEEFAKQIEIETRERNSNESTIQRGTS